MMSLRSIGTTSVLVMGLTLTLAGATYGFGYPQGNNFFLHRLLRLERSYYELSRTITQQQEQIDQLESTVASQTTLIDELIANTTFPPTGSVRLVDGTTSSEGRVEVFFFGNWGTVCQDFWSMDDARVVCNQLGLPSGNVEALKGTQSPMSPFGEGIGLIFLDNLLCTGSEASIAECPNNGIGIHNCDHTKDVGVRCNP